MKLSSSNNKKKYNENRVKKACRSYGPPLSKQMISITAVLEREEKKKGEERLFKEIVAENFSNLKRKMDTQIQEAPKTPNGLTYRPTLWHTVIKLLRVKDKEKLLKAEREKRLIIYKGTPPTPIRLRADFLAETLNV